MSKARRSRIVSSLIVTILVYLIFFFSLSDYSQVKQFDAAKWATLPLNFQALGALFTSHSSKSLDAYANTIFRKKLAESQDDSTPVSMAKYSIEGPSKSRHVIELPSFLFGKDENPHLTPFDPRLTFGITLDDLNAQFQNGVPLENLQISSFHWADWTDLSPLHRKLLSVVQIQEDCDSLAPLRNERSSNQKDMALDPHEYCLTDDDISYYLQNPHESPVSSGLLSKIYSSPIKTGFHVFDCPNRASQRIRIMAACSFLNDFMPPAAAVHFLLPTGPKDYSTLHVPVSQDPMNRVRLTDTYAATAAARKSRSIDLRKQLSKLMANVGSKTHTKLQYLKDIPHEAFLDKSEEIVAELGGKEGTLTFQDQQYLDSLRLSLDTPSPPKYFYEARLPSSQKGWASGGHYDWKFFKGLKTTSDVHLTHLHGLLSAWLRFTNANDITTWIAHGSLLGWYWNGLSFTWDADYDVQVPVADLHKLSQKFNQTIIVDFGSDSSKNIRLGRYFLDCGTWISHRGPGNGRNNIDARFIDMDSGLYVDITGLAVSSLQAPERYDPKRTLDSLIPTSTSQPLNPTAVFKKNDAAQLYNCRNKHFQSLSEISPLRLTMMEGVPAYIPNNFTEMLQNEYGSKGIRSVTFRSHIYLPRIRLWGKAREIVKVLREKEVQHPQILLEEEALTASKFADEFAIFTLDEKDYSELMSSDSDLLFEYLATKENTEFHQKEMELLLQGESTEHLFFKDNDDSPPWKHLRPDITNFMAVKEHRDFKKEMAEYTNMYKSFKQGKEYVPLIDSLKKILPVLGRRPGE